MTDERTDLQMSPTAAAHLSYHLRMAAVFAAAGELQESGSEAVLAWAILATSWPQADDEALAIASELIGQDRVAVSETHRLEARNHAHARSLDLVAHFTSVGLHEVAGLYETVAECLDATIATLSNNR